jgi:hypothetical protein
MKNTGIAIVSFALALMVLQSCHKETVTPVSFSTIDSTDNECRVTGTVDTTQWCNSVLNRASDTLFLTFAANVGITDSVCGRVTMAPSCPNPSNGFFIWNVSCTRQCLLKVVCVSTAFDVLYFNSYVINAEPITLGFDLRAQTAFRNDSSYRMYFGFYNSNDSLYYSGHGDIKIVK